MDIEYDSAYQIDRKRCDRRYRMEQADVNSCDPATACACATTHSNSLPAATGGGRSVWRSYMPVTSTLCEERDVTRNNGYTSKRCRRYAVNRTCAYLLVLCLGSALADPVVARVVNSQSWCKATIDDRLINLNPLQRADGKPSRSDCLKAMIILACFPAFVSLLAQRNFYDT